MKKGFTLIELLAVIVILAILALIVSPIISGVITNAKLSAAARSLEGYAQAIELAEIKYQAANQGSVTKVLSELSIEAKSKNKVTINSIVIEDSGIVSSINATVDGYSCTYNKDSGAECSNDDTLVVLPYTIKNPHENYNKELLLIFDKYNIGFECYYNNYCSTSERPNVNNARQEVYLLNKKLYEIIDPFNIKNISFYNDGRVIDDAEVLDVSKLQDNSVKMYYEFNIEDSSYYDVSFVADHDIVFPIDSSGFFANLIYLESISFNDAIDTTNVTNMSKMFAATGTDSINFALEFGNNFDTSNVTNMSNMFEQTGSSSSDFILNLGDKFNTSKVTNMSNMFNWTGLAGSNFTLELGNNFDTSNVTNMNQMFYQTGRDSLVFALDLKNKFDTSNVTNMSNMFEETGTCSTEFILKLGDKFDTSKVTNMYNMFSGTGYTSMTSLNLGDKFDTSNVTNMDSMFFNTGRESLVFTLDLGDKFDTSKVTNMSNMFSDTGYIGMTSLNLGDKFDTSNVTTMAGMFASTGYTNMTSLNLGDKFVNIASNNSNMFSDTGTSNCIIYVPSDVYYSNKQLKQNNAATTAYTESLEENRTFVQQ